MAAAISVPAHADNFPSKTVELICTTTPGSGAAHFCHMIANGLKEKDALNTPVKVVFKSGGSNFEPVLYVQNRPADGHTIMHMSASFAGYFNLPHFKYGAKDFDILAKIEKHLYAVGVNSKSPWKTYADLIKDAKANPGKISMGSNKIGSTHHRLQELLHKTVGINIRFVPYQGTGDVLKDVVGEHLEVGLVQPGNWLAQVRAGKARILLVLNETRMTHPDLKDIPIPADLGFKYNMPHQFQAFMVKKGTPKDRMQILQKALAKIATTKDYQAYIAKQPHVIPAFDANTEAMNKDFLEATKDTRAMMVNLGILKK
ncbi:MAG: tripartite tricarboxylate transporter substrate binding protein [Rhodospirillales bacterium]